MGLSTKEMEILREGGASGLDDTADINKVAYDLGREVLEREWHRILQDALDEDGAALLLGISRETLRERIHSQQLQLYKTVSQTGSWIFPRWQFSKGDLIPHLETLLGALSLEAHPVTVCRFMITENQDLEGDTTDCRYTPSAWLVRGYDPAPVIVQAKDL